MARPTDLIDISQPLRGGMPVWPGDTKYEYSLATTIQQSCSVNVGRLRLGTHSGTHIDAPFHFDPAGAKVHELDPGVYLGPARVIDLSGATPRSGIGVEELERCDLEMEGGVVERVLLRTGSWTDRERFPREIVYLSPEVANFLGQRGVRLVGVDTPSVDPIASKGLPAHHALLWRGIHILEGLVLDGVEPGEYELIALPLPLRDADGSPVRAVLREL